MCEAGLASTTCLGAWLRWTWASVVARVPSARSRRYAFAALSESNPFLLPILPPWMHLKFFGQPFLTSFYFLAILPLPLAASRRWIFFRVQNTGCNCHHGAHDVHVLRNDRIEILAVCLCSSWCESSRMLPYFLAAHSTPKAFLLFLCLWLQSWQLILPSFQNDKPCYRVDWGFKSQKWIGRCSFCRWIQSCPALASLRGLIDEFASAYVLFTGTYFPPAGNFGVLLSLHVFLLESFSRNSVFGTDLSIGKSPQIWTDGISHSLSTPKIMFAKPKTL